MDLNSKELNINCHSLSNLLNADSCVQIMGLLGNVNFDDPYERENFNETMKKLRNR